MKQSYPITKEPTLDLNHFLIHESIRVHEYHKLDYYFRLFFSFQLLV